MNNCLSEENLTPQQIAQSSLLSYVGLEYPKYIAEPMHELIATALEKVDSGDIRRLIICTPPQHGKPVWEENQVLMGNGSYKKLKDIKVGDYVITHKKRPKKVLKVFKQGLLPTIELKTNFGKNPCSALDHPFLTITGWKQAYNLKINDLLAIIKKEDINTKWDSYYLPDQIVEIKDTGLRKCRCLLVEDDHTFTIQNIVVHNTFLTSEFFPAWFLGRHPDWSTIAVTYNQTRANQVGGTVRNNLTSPIHKIVFPNCIISQDTQSVHHVATVQKGHYYSIGVGGSVMGRSAHLVLIDDPLRGREDAESKLVREKMKEWYAASIYTRLRPDNRIVIISTRWHCFHKNSLILTTDGWEKAQDIKRDHSLITHAGIEPVNKMESKQYNGNIYKFTIYGTPKPLEVTGNHKVLTVDGWKYARDITKNDWLIVPKMEGETVPQFDNPKKSNAKSIRGLKGTQNKVPKDKLKELLDEGKTYTECAKYFGFKDRSSIGRYATLYGLNRNANTVADPKMTDDPEFWRVVGYWLAEGSLAKARKHYDENNYTIIVLTIGSHENWIAKDIKQILSKYNINVSMSFHKKKTAVKVQFSCWQIAQYLKNNFGYYSSKKNLPEWASSLPNSCKKELIIGYFRGDGCFSSKIGYRASSVSLKMLTDFQRLLATMNIPSGVVKGKKAGKEKTIFDGNNSIDINIKDSYELRIHEYYIPWMNINREKYNKRTEKPSKIVGKRINEKQLELKIKKIEINRYNDLIYDFETNSHYITSGGVVVHNSEDLTGYLLKEHPQENWKVIELRAIAEEDDVLGRKVGEALCPNIYSLEHLKKVKVIEGTYNWESLYQQRPIARKGGIIQYDWIENNWYDKLPEEKDIVKTVISWDTAYRKQDLNDPTAGTIWYITKNGYYLADVFNEKLAFHKIISTIQRFHEKYMPSAHLIEGRASGQPIIDELRRTTTLPIIEVSTQNLDKEVRLGSVSHMFESGNVHFPEKAPWLIEAKDQLCLFPSYKYDDIVDSVTHFLRWANKPRYVRRPANKLYWK